MGPLTTDRSAACQIGDSRPEYSIQDKADGVGESVATGARAAGFDPLSGAAEGQGIENGIEFGNAGHSLRRIGLSRTQCRPCAVQARLPNPRRGAPAGTG